MAAPSSRHSTPSASSVWFPAIHLPGWVVPVGGGVLCLLLGAAIGYACYRCCCAGKREPPDEILSETVYDNSEYSEPSVGPRKDSKGAPISSFRGSVHATGADL